MKRSIGATETMCSMNQSEDKTKFERLRDKACEIGINTTESRFPIQRRTELSTSFGHKHIQKGQGTIGFNFSCEFN